MAEGLAVEGFTAVVEDETLRVSTGPALGVPFPSHELSQP
jgi:hypothetical protein